MRFGMSFVTALTLALSACATKTTNVDYKEHAQVRPDPTNTAQINSIATPPGFPPSSQILNKMVFTVPKYDGVKRDGETAFTLTNMHLTAYRLKLGDGSMRTAAIVDFTLHNHTQNNRGTHTHQMRFNLLGAAGNVLDPNQMVIELERDTCTPSNPNVSGLHIFQTDIFPLIERISFGWSGSWNYEGKC